MNICGAPVLYQAQSSLWSSQFSGGERCDHEIPQHRIWYKELYFKVPWMHKGGSP